MPVIVTEPLELVKAKSLLDWLKRPEAQLLRTVVATRSRMLKEAALESAFRATAGNTYDLNSIAQMKDAARYQAFLDILDEITRPDQPMKLETIKLK